MFADFDSVKSEGNLEGVDDSIITPHLLKADTDLKAIIPKVELEKIEFAAGGDVELLKSAESMLVLYYLIPVLVTVAGSQGGLVRTLGTGESTTTYLTSGEAKRMAKDYRSKGLKIINKIRTDAPTDHVRAHGFSLWPL